MASLNEGRKVYELKGRKSLDDDWRVIGVRYSVEGIVDLFKRHDKTWRYLIMEKATFKG